MADWVLTKKTVHIFMSSTVWEFLTVKPGRAFPSLAN